MLREAGGAPGGPRVLVAVRLSGAGSNALEQAGELGFRFTALTVVRPLGNALAIAGMAPHVVLPRLIEDAAQALRDQARCACPHASMDVVVRVGDPLPEIMRLLRQRDFDLIIVGGSRRRRSARLMRPLATRLPRRTTVGVRVATDMLGIDSRGASLRNVARGAGS